MVGKEADPVADVPLHRDWLRRKPPNPNLHLNQMNGAQPVPASETSEGT
jgi:hypothetical protein